MDTVKLTQEDLVEVLKGYLTGAIWTEGETTDKFTIDDLSEDSQIQAYIDIKEFIKNAGEDAVSEAVEEHGLSHLGMDIWLTRNSHGAGFFDHSYEHEDELMKAAHDLKGVELYVGDDNELHFSNSHM